MTDIKAVRTIPAVLAACAALALALACSAAPSSEAFADNAQTRLSVADPLESQSGSDRIIQGALSVSGLEDVGGRPGLVVGFHGSDESAGEAIAFSYIDIANRSTDDATITVTSSNPEIAAIDANSAAFMLSSGSAGATVGIDLFRAGTASITISNGTDTVEVPLVSYPRSAAKIQSVRRAAYNKVRIAWTPMQGVTGYEIRRAKANSYGDAKGDYTTVARVAGASKKSATVTAKWEKTYSYLVIPYVNEGDSRFAADDTYGFTFGYALSAPKVTMKPVVKSGTKNLKVSWKAVSGASKFKILRSVHENYGYKTIATAKAKVAKSATGTVSASYTDKKVKKGTTYYYRIRAVYPGSGNVDSASYGQMISKKSSVARRAISMADIFDYVGYLKTGLGWAANYLYYYKAGGKVHVVCYADGALKDYTLNAKMKKAAVKTIALPKHDAWGGFYHGPDGNNYVVLGYDNDKRSKTKTAIKVVKYSGAWKKGKSTSIKGGATSGGIRKVMTTKFEMQDNTLVLYIRHSTFGKETFYSSPADFAECFINSKTMKLADEPYDIGGYERVLDLRSKDNGTYLVYTDFIRNNPGFRLTGPDGLNTISFEFLDEEAGGSYRHNVGVSGIEVGAKNVITCGTAVPHVYKVAGVTGYASDWKKNVFVTVTNRTTGKSKVKWLTSINPKKGTKTVCETCMVKLSDNRFAVFFNVRDDKTGKLTLRYIAVNSSGKKVLSKTYSNILFTGSSKPVLSNGCIYWVEKPTSDGPVVYRIPAL